MANKARVEIRDDVLYNTLVVDSKDILIQSLREWFMHDNIYTYKQDEFGFPLLPPASLVDGGSAGREGIIWGETSTKIIITDDYRFQSRFFPAITISDNGGSNYEISFNQELSCVKYMVEDVVREGRIIQRRVPSHVLFAGSWKQNYSINIIAEDHPTRKRLKDIVAILLMNVLRNTLLERGIFIEKMSFGGDREEDFKNGYYYYATINVDLYSEWRREIPVTMLVEAISVSSSLLAAALHPQDIAVLRQCVANHPMAAFYSSEQRDGTEGGSLFTTHTHEGVELNWRAAACQDKEPK